MSLKGIAIALTGTFTLLAIVVSAGTCQAGTNRYVGKQDMRPTVSMEVIDHSQWDQLLAKYVDEHGAVNYRGWKSSTDGRKELLSYLDRLSGADPQAAATQEAKLAFWINAYNAVTVEGILQEYPTSSIRNHSAKVFGYNIWDDLLLYVGGKPYSLNQIEHEILRKMNEPRIHFAIVCASKGCPRLLNQAYTVDRIRKQLAMNTSHFFAQPTNLTVEQNTVTLSSILDWFGEDFGDTDQKILERIVPWFPDEQRTLVSGNSPIIRYAEYDWSINEQVATQ